MKTPINTWNRYAVALLIFSATSFSSFAQTKTDQEISGILHHIIDDDFEKGVSRSHFRLLDPKTKKVKDLIFKDGKIPEKLLHARSGSRIKIKGKKTSTDQSINLEESSSAYAADLMELTTFPADAVTGTRKVMAIQIDFMDATGSSFDEARVFKSVFDLNTPSSVRNYFRKNSQGQFDFDGKTGRVKLNLYLSKTTSCTFSDRDRWVAMADQILNSQGYNTTQYEHRIYFIPQISACNFGGTTYLGGGSDFTRDLARILVKVNIPQVINHEFAHHLGISHASSGTPGTASWNEYGDHSTAMGSQMNSPELNAPHKFTLGWIPEDKVQTITANGTYKVAPLSSSSSSVSHPQIYRIKKGTAANDYYYLSFRDRANFFDQNLDATYYNRLNITRYDEYYKNFTYFINALGVGGSATLPSTNFTVKATVQNSSYIEFTVSGGSTAPSTTDTIKPSVTLTSPATGSVIAAGSSITLSATATDNVAVTKVEFYVNGAAQVDSTAPYALSATMPTGTNIPVKARAYDAAGNYTDSAIHYVSNPTSTADTTIPSVYLSSPVNGATFAAGATVTASATASDNKAVSKVLFYVGGVLKSTDTVAPYNYSFSMPTSSSLSVYAIAYDAAGNLKKSAISYIKNPTTTTADTTIPSVYLSSPVNGATFAAGATVTASATASDNKAVAKVLFYVGGVLKSTDTVAPYNYSFSMPTSSSLSVYAIAYDAAGNLKKSAISYIKNPTTTTTTADTIRPSVYLNTPAVGTKIAAGSTFTITATASDNKAVTKVSFYFNGKYCTDTTAPYSCSFLMTTGSNLMLRATAYDAANNYKYSNLVYVSN